MPGNGRTGRSTGSPCTLFSWMCGLTFTMPPSWDRASFSERASDCCTDQATLADPLVRRLLVETLGEAFGGGVGGVYDDTLAVARPWGFAPEVITTPAWLWQGDADTTVLPGLAEELARKLPQCQATRLSGEGHLLVCTHWRTMLQALQVAPAKPASGTEHSFGT